MSVKTYDYVTPGDYVYDTNKILVSGGVVSLKESLVNCYLRYHFNEVSGTNVADSSGNGRNLTTVNSPTWSSGKLNNAITFNGTTQYAYAVGQAGFERTSAFSISAWIKTSNNGTQQRIANKHDAVVGQQRGWNFRIDAGGVLRFALVSIVGSNYLRVKSNVSGINNGAWRNVVVTYDGSSTAAGVKFYIDGVLDATSVIEADLLSDTIINTGNFVVGADPVGTAVFFNGSIDELIMHARELSQAEIDFIYNSNNGTEIYAYFSDVPTIMPSASFYDVDLKRCDTFLEVKTGGGSVEYQLSNDSGSTWVYYTGSGWDLASASQHNTAVVINSNIATLPLSSQEIIYKAFLISDGTQQVLLDTNSFDYVQDEYPIIDAGVAKTTKDHTNLVMFSDCAFTDTDGTITDVWYMIDGIVESWTAILIGGYGSLLLAVQAFSYLFDEYGDNTVRLKIRDDFGHETQDSLVVTVTKYTKTVNIVSSITGLDLPNIMFDPGDGSGFIVRNSPFSYSWEYGNFNISTYRDDFNQESVGILIENEDSITITLPPIITISEVQGLAGYISDTDTLQISAWLNHNGIVVVNPVSCSVVLENGEGIIFYSSISYSPDSEGDFYFSANPSGLPDEGTYHIHVSISYNGITTSAIIGVGKLVTISVWDELYANHTSEGSFGYYIKWIVDNFNSVFEYLPELNKYIRRVLRLP